LAIARRSSDTAPADVATPRTVPIEATPPAPALLFEPAAVIAPPVGLVALAVRFRNVPVDVALIDDIAFPLGRAVAPEPLKPPMAVVVMAKPLGPL
jgi:hypothetical protein